MCSIKLIVLFAVVACAVSEPPRRRLNFRQFSRQETADNAPADPPASEGYNYQAPAGERLRLPIKFTHFSRQEDASSAGYSYPKPTQSYGPPEEEKPTEEPSTEYGAPATTEETDYDETATENPQAETLRSLQATQLRRHNAKLTRSQKLQNKAFLDPAFAQPIYYIQNPADLIQPQYVYVF